MGRVFAFRLSQGGDLRRYYPLTEAAQDEYIAWRDTQNREQG